MLTLFSLWLFEYSFDHEKQLIAYVKKARGKGNNEWKVIKFTLKAFRVITFGVCASSVTFIVYSLLNHHK